VFGHVLPSVQPQSFLEWTHSSFEPFLAEFYTILLEEHKFALEMLEVGIYSSLQSPKLARLIQAMFKSGDCGSQGGY
jgi:hypothetical protein